MPLFMLAVALVIGLELIGRLLPLGRRGLPRLVMAGAVGMYLGALLAVSLSSREIVLQPGKVKRFCGFYLDCHLGVAVIGVRQGAAFSSGPAGAGTNRTRYLVALEARNDARRATLALHQPQVVVVDDSGRRYAPLRDKEAGVLSQPIRPGFSIRAEIAFDLPADVRHPRLLVVEGNWTGRLLERFLIGDDDSLLHAPTTLSLAGS